MTIVYNTVTLQASSITLNNSTRLDITLTPPTTGIVHGAVTVNNVAFPILSAGSNVYYADLHGFRIHQCSISPLFVVMADNDGPVEYTVAPLTMTVLPSTNYFPRPLDTIESWFKAQWDQTKVKAPRILKQRDIKSASDPTLQTGIIVIKELETHSKTRGRGDYFDGDYPCSVKVIQEGNRQSADIYFKAIVGEVMRILGNSWNYIDYTEFDYMIFENNGYDSSDEGAGRYEWEIRIKLIGVLRGRTTVPVSPAGDIIISTARLGVLATSYANLVATYPPSLAYEFWYGMVRVGAGTRSSMYICMRADSGAYSWILDADGGV